MTDVLRWTGIMKVREVPKIWTPQDFAYWWLPREVYPKGHTQAGQVKVSSRLSEEEKDLLTIAQAPNTLLVAGVQNIMQMIIDQSTTSPGVMFQYLALGNGSISGVLPGDSTLASEYYRTVITGISNFGASALISTLVPAGSGTGTVTNTGLFGIAATGTANSGTLMSQVMYLPAFPKLAGSAFTFDYGVSLISN